MRSARPSSPFRDPRISASGAQAMGRRRPGDVFFQAGTMTASMTDIGAQSGHHDSRPGDSALKRAVLHEPCPSKTADAFIKAVLKLSAKMRM